MRYILLLLLLLAIVHLNYAQEDPDCAAAPNPQLVAGGYGQVTEGDANNVRDQASRDGNKIGEIPGGEDFFVLDGPVCADGFNWWKVNYHSLVGWTVEGSGSTYFVIPLDANTVPSIHYPLSVDNPIAAGVQARVNLAGLNIHSEPSPNAAVLSQTTASETVEIVADSVRAEGFVWWQIRQANGTVGWVVEQFPQSEGLQEEVLVQTLFPLCPYNSERLSLVLYPYIYSSARDGSQRCVLYKQQSRATFAPFANLKFMPSDTFWSPQGDVFFFVDYDSAVNCCAFRLYSLAADGSALRNLSPNADVVWAEWSPDGSKIALAMNHEAWVMNRDGSAAMRLSEPGHSIDYVAWYPDNQSIFYVEYIPEIPNAVQVYTRTDLIFYSIGLDGSNPQELFRLDGDIQVDDVTLSPNGLYLALGQTNFDEHLEYDGRGAYLYDTGSWEASPLDTYLSYHWSPDGQSLVLTNDAIATGDPYSTQILNIATGESQVIGQFFPFSWSADRQRLYSLPIAGFKVYEISSGEVQTYLEEEIQPLIDQNSYGGFDSIREQGAN